MAWWSIGIGDDEIGDQPANLVEIALDEFAAGRRAAGAPPPTPKALLGAFTRSLVRHASASGLDGIEERAAGKSPVIHRAGDSDDPQLALLTDPLVAKLMDCYRDYRDRDARPAELSAVLAFVLRYEPDRFLSNAKDWKLQVLRPIFGSKASEGQE
jgi:hypothetical protein